MELTEKQLVALLALVKEEWEWEETPEVLAALEQLHKSSALVEEKKV